MIDCKRMTEAALSWNGYFIFSGKSYSMNFTSFNLGGDGKIRCCGNDLYGNFTIEGVLNHQSGQVTLSKRHQWPSTYEAQLSGNYDGK